MTNHERYITFFPGKGIYSLPDGAEILSVYKIEEARRLLDAFSYKKIHGFLPPSLSPKETEQAALLEAFCATEGFQFEGTREKSAEPSLELVFSDIENKGTRTSMNKTSIDWKSVESGLQQSGFSLGKRTFLKNAFDALCPVFYLHDADGGVIAEGKGITEEQAIRSALAEGVERVTGIGPGEQARNRISIDTYEHLYHRKNWDLGELTGPRDAFSSAQLTEWIPARNISRDEDCFVPAELAYYEYIPKLTRTRLFSLHHTMGLAAGASLEDATLSGIFEVLERDAYWITMRCRINGPDIDLGLLPALDPTIQEIVRLLETLGFKLVLKDMSLDWGVPIAHAVLMDTRGGIPAFSHGTGASFSWEVAVARAVCETVQMYAGLDVVLNEHFQWKEVVSVTGVLGKPELAWSDPLYRTHLEHVLTPSPVTWQPDKEIDSIETLLKRLKDMGHEIIVADLQSELPLKVVRVFITNATPPDTRLEKVGSRLQKWAAKEDLTHGLYADPILT
ncbi:MAG: hypothetical protein JWO84_302 [Parcubacteria group bacterium]|nr:hypothetical protein [Parcubacteria group bacterium]